MRRMNGRSVTSCIGARTRAGRPWGKSDRIFKVLFSDHNSYITNPNSLPLMKATLTLLFGATAVAQAGGIYWTNRGASLLERSLYDGTGRATVLASAGTNVRGIALDLTNNLIYYADNGADILY